MKLCTVLQKKKTHKTPLKKTLCFSNLTSKVTTFMFYKPFCLSELE